MDSAIELASFNLPQNGILERKVEKHNEVE